MPRVPTYDGPQLRRAALQPAFQQNTDVSAPMRQAATGLAGLSEVADRIGLQRDAEQAFRTEVEIKTDWLKTDADLRKRYRGASAAGYEAEVDKFWQDAKAKALPALSQRAQALSGRSLGTAALQAKSGAISYVATETERAQDEAFSASKTIEIQRALTDGRAEAFEAAREQLMQRNAQQGATRGWDSERVQAANLRDLTTLHAGAIAAELDRNPAAARRYFDTNKGEIAANLHADIAAKVDSAGSLARAQAAADEIVGQNLPIDAALRSVEQRFSGDDEKAIKAEIKDRYAYAEAAARKRDADNYGSALLEVEQRGRVRPSTFARLTDGHKAAVLERQRAEGRQRAMDARGQAVATDWGLYLDLRQTAVNDPKSFAALDLRRHLDKLAAPQLEQLLDLQGRTSKPVAQREAVTLTQQMNSTMSALNIARPEQKGQFLSFVQSAVDDAQMAKGKPLTFDERQKIIDEAVLQGPDPDAWLWGEKRMFQLTPEQRSRFKPNVATDAPATELDALNEALKAQGLALTPANRLALYNRVTQKAAQ